MAERLLPVEMVALAFAYAVLTWRRSKRSSNPIELGRATCFMVGLCVLALALVSPIDAESANALSWHMVQHLLIISVAAPLLAVGRPVELLFETLPYRLTARRVEWHATWGMGVAGVAALATLVVWHVPTLYQAALSSEPAHIVEHATLLLTSMWLWAALISAETLGVSVVWLFVLTLPTTAFGVAMTIARTPWYSDYVRTTRADAVSDQQLAGVVMWAFGGLAALAGGIALFATWLTSGSSATTHDARPSTNAAPTC